MVNGRCSGFDCWYVAVTVRRQKRLQTVARQLRVGNLFRRKGFSAKVTYNVSIRDAQMWTFSADTILIFKLQIQSITDTDKQNTGAHAAADVTQGGGVHSLVLSSHAFSIYWRKVQAAGKHTIN